MSECNKNPITIFPCEVEEYGVAEAIIIQQIRNWTTYNQKQGTPSHYQDGHWWCYGSMTFWSEMTGLNEKTLYKKFKSLEDDGLLISGCFNKLKLDRTKWYRVNPSLHMGKSISPNRVNDISPNRVNGITPSEEMSFPPLEGTIPRDMNVMNMNYITFNSLLEKFNYPKDRSNRVVKELWDNLNDEDKKKVESKSDDFISYSKKNGYSPNLKQYLTDGWTWDLTIQSESNKINKNKILL